MANRPLIAISLGVVGAYFVYDGIHGRYLWSDILSVLRGEALAPSGSNSQNNSNVTVQSVTPIGASVSGSMAGESARSGSGPAGMVQLMHLNGTPYTGMYLDPQAAQAYQTAQIMIGRDIPITSGWRSLAQENAGNNSVGAASYHVRGAAIDVWNDPINGVTPSLDPQIIQALTAVGFARFDPTGRRGEQMHWSFGGVG